MLATRFIPCRRASLERAWDYSAALPEGRLRRATLEVEELFLGSRTGACWQVPWMGRGCFRRVAPRCYLAAKGVGPGPRSEIMRQELDARMAGTWRGGCLRLETGTPYPLLVKFLDSAGSWEVVDPRPEGFSIFSDLVRDAEAALLLQDFGVRALRPLRLLRDRLKEPWRQPTPDGLAAYLAERLPAAIFDHLRPAEPADRFTREVARALRFQRLAYCRLDGGVLIRSALSPYRVANLQVVAAGGDGTAHRHLIGHMLRAFSHRRGSPATVQELGLRFTRELARTAAALFREGILHGQLNLHFQNVSLAGEIADFDSMVFLRLVPLLAAGVPFPASGRHPSIYATYWQRMEEAGERWGIDLAASLTADFRAAAGLTPDGFLDSRVAAYSLRQIYDLHVHAQRTVDLLHRRAAGLKRPGTVLGPDRSAEVRACFARTFLGLLEAEGGRKLLAWSLRRGFAMLRDRLVDCRGRSTLYAWSSPDAPVQQMVHPCDETRQEHIHRDVDAFFNEISPGVRAASRAAGLRAAAAASPAAYSGRRRS